jgi:hypothetical protein
MALSTVCAAEVSIHTYRQTRSRKAYCDQSALPAAVLQETSNLEDAVGNSSEVGRAPVSCSWDLPTCSSGILLELPTSDSSLDDDMGKKSEKAIARCRHILLRPPLDEETSVSTDRLYFSVRTSGQPASF